MNGAIIDEKEIRKAVAILKPTNQLFECRVICNNKRTYSGYFTSADTLCEAFNEIYDFADCNIYFTLNSLNPQCYDRHQRDKFVKNAEATTSDSDVTGYDWMLIDLDPKRPAKTSSTNEQIAKAKQLCIRICQFMQNVGFETPVLAFSGNGYHLLYKVSMKNDSDNKKLIENSLKTLNMLFSDLDIDVDMKNFNPSRVCKLYGTRAQKGLDSETAPHRMSKLLRIPEEIKPTDKIYLEKLTGYYPQEEKPQRYNNYRPRDFNVGEWLEKHHIAYQKTGYSGGDKYILDHCPFDENHKGKDAVIFQSSSGAIGFNCFHNSCADKKWRDVRLLFEPDAYEKRQQDYEKRIYSKAKPIKKIEVQANEPLWLTAMDIFNRPKVEERFVRTGITELDRKMRGLKLGAVSVLSGLRAASKSTLIGSIGLNCCQNKNKVGVYSGELSPENYMRWLNRQAAGKGHLEPTQYEGFYNVSRQNQEMIARWMGEYFILYNNKYGNDYAALKDEFRRKIEEDKLELLILDNLMAFNISGLSDNKYDAQTAFVWSLHELASETNCHILFVAHPRKAMGFLRLDDISGTADIGNAVDNAFIVHRNNNDFQRLSKQMFGWKDSNPIYMATNVIEIAKDRDGGNQDVFIPLWYEPETKRLKNSMDENRIYSWNTKDVYGDFTPVKDDQDIVFD